MKLAVMQPYFFPYIGYWQLLNAADQYIIYDDVNYIKGGWINRNRILMNMRAQYINIRLRNASPNKLINEIELLGDTVYNNKLLKTIQYSYKHAPYFELVYPQIEAIISQAENNLAKFLEYCIVTICEYMNIDTKIIISSTLEKDNSLRGKNKVQHICHLLEANEYINAIGGRELYPHDEFKKNGIDLKFLKPSNIYYKQFDNDFIANLSIIDVMMFNSKQEIHKMLSDYQLLD